MLPPQRIGVIDAVAPGKCRVDEGHGLVTDIGPPRRVTQAHVVIEELTQAEVLGKGGDQDEPGARYRVGVVEGHVEAIEAVR